jgi:hypothetical protein
MATRMARHIAVAANSIDLSNLVLPGRNRCAFDCRRLAAGSSRSSVRQRGNSPVPAPLPVRRMLKPSGV